MLGNTDSVVDLSTLDDRCNLACPFNQQEQDPFSFQPCVYTVKVMEVFKGSYSVSVWVGREGGLQGI